MSKKRVYELEVDGRMLGVAELARRVGIDPESMRQRFRRHGADRDRILAPRSRRAQHCTLFVDGTSLVEAALAAGLKYQTVYKRIKRGMSPRDALRPDLDPRRCKYSWRGETWYLTELARVLGVSYGALARRIRSGLDLESALSIPFTRGRRRNK